MKRMAALTATVLAMVPGPAVAQDVSVGLRAGVTRTNLSTEGPEPRDFESRTGLLFGGVLQVDVSETFGVQSGLLYVQKGAETGLTVGVSALKVDYAEVPLLGVFTLPSEGRFALRVLAGPVFSFRASCSLGDAVAGSDQDVDCGPAGIETESLDLGLHGGAGVTFSARDDATLFLDLGYTHGFSRVESAENVPDTRNRAFLVSAGVIIRLP